MGILSRLFGPPRVEPAPEGRSVEPERFGHFAFAFVHDQLFLGGDDSWVAELEAAAGTSLDDLLIAFRTEYVIFMLGAVCDAVQEEAGGGSADRVAAAAASAAVEAFAEQLEGNAEEIDWEDVRELVEAQSRDYAGIGGNRGEDTRLGRIAFGRLAPNEDPDPGAVECLERQYRRMIESTRDMLERNPLTPAED